MCKLSFGLHLDSVCYMLSRIPCEPSIYRLVKVQARRSYLALFIDQRMNVTNNKLPYEAPAADAFQLSAAPLNICVQFSGEADFNDFEEGEAL